ncbi:MAG: PEGA domain-containing protein [Desulfobacteraceae bacterium]
MKYFRFAYMIAPVVVFLLLCVGGGIQGITVDPAMAEEYEEDRPLSVTPRQLPEGSHTWGPAPGGIIYDGYYPPPDLYYQYGHPARPHCYHPYCPPYYGYPPYYEPARPWYEEDNQPAPAGRLLLLVEPVKAEAFVDGYPLERHTDLSYEIGLLEGEHQGEVKAEGYMSYKKTVSIRGGERLKMAIRLEKEGRGENPGQND